MPAPILQPDRLLDHPLIAWTAKQASANPRSVLLRRCVRLVRQGRRRIPALAAAGPLGTRAGVVRVGLDIAEGMLRHARAASAAPHWVCADAEQLPLAADSVDLVFSSLALQWCETPGQALREIARVLKPVGRLAVSDIALKQPLPRELSESLTAYAGCIAGAVLIDDYRRLLLDAGFAAVEVVDTGADLNAYSQVENQAACCSPAGGSSSSTARSRPAPTARRRSGSTSRSTPARWR